MLLRGLLSKVKLHLGARVAPGGHASIATSVPLAVTSQPWEGIMSNVLALQCLNITEAEAERGCASLFSISITRVA